jgi:soluble lytic murein transglycosylase-like protein
MQIGPWLVIRGFILGAILVIILTSVATAGATLSTQPTDLAAQNNFAQANNQDNPGAGDCQISSRFPGQIQRWCELITRYAEKEGISPDLIAALVWQESGGKPSAYSGSGAVGLMQVMPRDGIAASFECASGPCFASRPTTQELKDPEFNIQFGTHMLASLVKRSGELREALKAYGPKDMGYYYADKVLAIYNLYSN